MEQIDSQLSTGLPGLDRILKGLMPGDNIVWQVDSIENYLPFLPFYCKSAHELGHPLIYFRFAEHPQLISEGSGARIHHLNPEEGFEAFVGKIHRVYDSTGPGGFYVFDCLSDLAVAWSSDRMLGNFFLLNCPYLYQVGAIAYFALLRGAHSFHANSALTDATQVLLDVYRHEDKIYVHPLKVQSRYSSSMYMLHAWEADGFHPITESAIISGITTSVPWTPLESYNYRPGIWGRAFLQGREILNSIRQDRMDKEVGEDYLRKLLPMAISRDKRILKLAEQYFTLADVLNIQRRMIGTGLIGGKSVGMVLARAVLRAKSRRLAELLEPHDSFFVGSDVFHTFLVRNGIWWIREKQKDPDTFLEGAEEARRHMLAGTFPDYIEKQFADMLDYFGQSPIIVRSSSLLEDNFGNAFAGKYESVFCGNQGTRAARMDDFLSAIRTVYASAMSEKALQYRAQRRLLHLDEQMALLIQRVSGAIYGETLYYPQIAGVGLSFNPYVWNRRIDPRAGMLRLVFGLGTRAVDRRDDDYTRLVALNDPDRRPETNFDEVRQYSQHKVDVIDLEANKVTSTDFASVAKASPSLPIERFASQDHDLIRRAREAGMTDVFSRVLTFDELFSQTDFIGNMREMLQILQGAYGSPVDVEFATNFLRDGGYKINLLQCRPLQVKEGGQIQDPPEDISAEALIVEVHGAVIGRSRCTRVDRIIHVVPAAYSQLPVAHRHSVARSIGRLTHLQPPGQAQTLMLLGPGRWCTTSPSLGVPVHFAEINTVSIICEIVAMHDQLAPDVSLGTHFFNDLVELDMLYFALFPGKPENELNRQFLEESPNRLADLLPEAAKWAHVIRVIDADDPPGGKGIYVNANPLKQRVVSYLRDSNQPHTP